MRLDHGDGGILGDGQHARPILDRNDAIDGGVRGAARDNGTDVAFGRAIDVEDARPGASSAMRG